MSIVGRIESEIERLEGELKWLTSRIEEGESDWLSENEVNWDSINSQVEDVDNCCTDLIDVVNELLETLKELI